MASDNLCDAINDAIKNEERPSQSLSESDATLLRKIWEQCELGSTDTSTINLPELRNLRALELVDLGNRKTVITWNYGPPTESPDMATVCVRLTGRGQKLLQAAWPDFYHQVVMGWTKAQIKRQKTRTV